MKEPAVRIQGLVKDFSPGMRGLKLRAVDHLDLEVGDNEVFGLLGPNGSGKSTTIKIILGLLAPTEGGCSIYGEKSAAVHARRSVGFLPEAPYFHRFRSGRELVRFYGRICGMPRAELEDRVDSVIELVGMREAADRRVSTYSKGMLQRIGLAQALVHDPRLVVLDEPTAGVDPLGSAAIASIIRELKKRGKTVLISSHLLAEIEGLCDRVAILHRGRCIREGRVDELVEDAAADMLVVEGLEAEGREVVERAIEEQGGRIRRAGKPRRSLGEIFLDEVNRREQPNRPISEDEAFGKKKGGQA
ncbi:MAG: ABC transporter ATP-binding protein [Opitutales bacterium]